MRALLDSHAVLWFQAGDTRLSHLVRNMISSRSHELLFSSISALEISIKYARKKLQLSAPPDVFIHRTIDMLGLIRLDLTIDHATRVANLPMHHRDPFDRALVAQAQLEAVPIITDDSLIHRYSIQTVW